MFDPIIWDAPRLCRLANIIGAVECGARIFSILMSKAGLTSPRPGPGLCALAGRAI